MRHGDIYWDIISEDFVVMLRSKEVSNEYRRFWLGFTKSSFCSNGITTEPLNHWIYLGNISEGLQNFAEELEKQHGSK